MLIIDYARKFAIHRPKDECQQHPGKEGKKNLSDLTSKNKRGCVTNLLDVPSFCLKTKHSRVVIFQSRWKRNHKNGSQENR